MQGLAITHKGIEDVTQLEIEEILGVKSKAKDGAVVFPTKKPEQLLAFAYRAQSVIKVLLLLEELNIEKLDDFKEFSPKELPAKGTTFAVRCIRIGEHSFSTNDVEKKVGEAILAAHNLKVKLEKPNLQFFVYLTGKQAWIGIDMTGTDLSKREYRIFNPTQPIKSTIAYAMLRLAKITEDQYILDPFSAAGIVPIEAGLFFSEKSPHFYRKASFQTLPEIDATSIFSQADKKSKEPKAKICVMHPQFNAISAAKKNAKIAGVEKFLQFSRTDIDWVDTKFREEEVDVIVTCMPSTKKEALDLEKTYKEFFYQAEFVLNKKGMMVLLCHKKDLIEKHKGVFSIVQERTIEQGELKLQALILKR